MKHFYIFYYWPFFLYLNVAMMFLLLKDIPIQNLDLRQSMIALIIKLDQSMYLHLRS